jgi:rod shape-determining protein MreD
VSIYLVVPLLAAIGLLQTTIVPHLVIMGVFPNLPLLVVVSWSLLRGTREGIVWAFVAGVVVDLFSGAPFGAATLSMIAAAALSGLGQATVLRAQMVLPLVAMFLVTVVYELLFLLIVRIAGQSVAWLDSLFHVVAPAALLNTLLMPIVLGGLRILHNRLGREEMEW